jgi:hypothetical protein
MTLATSEFFKQDKLASRLLNVYLPDSRIKGAVYCGNGDDDRFLALSRFRILHNMEAGAIITAFD